MHALLIKRADQLVTFIDGAADVTEYMAIVSTIMAKCRQRRLAAGH